MNYNSAQIAYIIGAKTENLENYNISVLLTDSRSLSFPEESLFFAIETEKNDGHKYILPLYNKGVRNFVVTKIPENLAGLDGANFLVVKDSLKALQILARPHRTQLDRPVLGITGGSVKAIVKEGLYQLLNDSKDIVRSPRSYNSQIGVPLSVWQINENNDLAIFEAGISKVNEMDKLSDIIRPTIGVLTNIGQPDRKNVV